MATRRQTQDDQHETAEAQAEQPAAPGGLEHTNGGQTTRSDATDVGAPMAATPPEGYVERQGPEDALGAEPTRGDYTGRIDSGPHVRMDPIPEGKRDDRELNAGEEDEGIGFTEPGPNVAPVEVVAGTGSPVEQSAPAEESTEGSEAA